jgi:hypothetical protein
MSDLPDFNDNYIPELPSGCGYQGYEFGASYPDSQCFGGQLYDMDACEGGLLFAPTDYILCPMCRPKEAIAQYKEQFLSTSWTNRRGKSKFMSKRNCARFARQIVNSIRKNRKNGTEPWKMQINKQTGKSF